MTYDQAKIRKQELETALEATSDAVQAFPRNAMGLTPDDVKALPAYRQARADYAVALNRLRTFNESFLKIFAAEYRAERLARRS